MHSSWVQNDVDFFGHLISMMYINHDATARIIVQSGRCWTMLKMAITNDCFNLCNDAKLCVLNSRVTSPNDNYACTTRRGYSIIDYMFFPPGCVR